MRKPVSANNKGADQPAHPRSLISTFFVRSLDSIYLYLLYQIFHDSSLLLYLSRAGLNLTWSKFPKSGFLVTWLKLRHMRYDNNTKVLFVIQFGDEKII